MTTDNKSIDSGILSIFGKRKSGKTKLAELISYDCYERGAFVWISDPVGNWPREYRTTIENFTATYKPHRLAVFSVDEPGDVADLAYGPLNNPDAQQKIVLILDEIDLSADRNSYKSEGIKNIIRRGRHRDISLVLTGQRPANAHADIFSLSTSICFFNLDHHADLKTIAERCGPKYAETIQHLEPFYFVQWPEGIIAKAGIDAPAVEFILK